MFFVAWLELKANDQLQTRRFLQGGLLKCDLSGFQITMVPAPWNSRVSFIVLILCALELVHVGPNWFGGKSHVKCQMLFFSDVPHKKTQWTSIHCDPHTKISTRSRKIMSVRRSAHLLLGHHASRVEQKNKHLGASISFYHICIVLTVL